MPPLSSPTTNRTQNCRSDDANVARPIGLGIEACVDAQVVHGGRFGTGRLSVWAMMPRTLFVMSILVSLTVTELWW